MNGHHADCSCTQCCKARDVGLDRALELIREMQAVVEEHAGYGRGPLDRDEFYCPICGGHHANYSLIQHSANCWLGALLIKADAFLSEHAEHE